MYITIGKVLSLGCGYFSGIFGDAIPCTIDYKTLKIIAENTIFLQELPLKKLITIAEKELVKVYGKRVLEQRPWKITRSDEKSITLTGTFHGQGLGGVAEITLQKSNGKVLRMIHGK